jgi:hypothetical protein
MMIAVSTANATHTTANACVDLSGKAIVASDLIFCLQFRDQDTEDLIMDTTQAAGVVLYK